jgi:NAD(P)H-dependent nitrite reductase small subunit
MAFIETKLKPDDVAVGASQFVMVGETQVALFRTAEGLFALDNICPHRGAPLHEGFVSDGQVTCPWHQWQFQLEDGRCRNIPGARVDSFPVEVRDGVIWVKLKD